MAYRPSMAPRRPTSASSRWEALGDIESMIFLEALRQFQFKARRKIAACSRVSGAQHHSCRRTKDQAYAARQCSQMAGRSLTSSCRSSMPLEGGIAEKLAMFCHVNKSNVLSVHDVPNIYHAKDAP